MPTSLQDIRETLSINSGAQNLTPKIISRLLLEYNRKYSPLRRALPRETWLTQTYNFNQRNSLPKAQSTTFAPTTGQVAASQSNYAQTSFNIKPLQAQLDIDTVSAQVATVNGNLFDLEIAGAAKALAWYEEILHMYGSAGATINTLRQEWDGLDVLTASTNKVDAATTLVSTTLLDNMLDAIRVVSAADLGDDYFYLVSPKMKSAINRLFQQYVRNNEGVRIYARDDYGIPGSGVVDNALDGGIECLSYRGIPIVETSFLSSQGQMGTIAPTAAGTGSQLLAQAYYYVVEAVTKYGITLASPEVSITPTAGQNVTLSWSTPTINDPFGNAIDIISYRIHRGTAAAGESLYAIVSAYNNTDAAITSFVDTGAPINPYTTTSAYAVTLASSGGAAIPDGVTFPRVQSGSQVVEDIFLIPRNPDFCVVPVLNEQQVQMLAPINARTRQFALTADMTLALRAPAFASKLCRVRAV